MVRGEWTALDGILRSQQGLLNSRNHGRSDQVLGRIATPRETQGCFDAYPYHGFSAKMPECDNVLGCVARQAMRGNKPSCLSKESGVACQMWPSRWQKPTRRSAKGIREGARLIRTDSRQGEGSLVPVHVATRPIATWFCGSWQRLERK